MRTALFTQSKLSTLLTSRNGKDNGIKNRAKGFLTLFELDIVSLRMLTILFKVGLLKRQAHSDRLLVIGKKA